jgi:hypothetical protein
MPSKQERTVPAPRQRFPSTVPPTPAEEQAAGSSWERRGLLGRLVRRG